jgi:hypothetical protein
MGDFFRGWMKLKNAWVPIKLALSAFHYLHVVGNVNIAENIARGLNEKGLGNKLRAVGEGLKLSAQDTLFSLPLDRFGSPEMQNYAGKRFREIWRTPDNQLTPWERTVRDLYKEAGVSPDMSEQLRVSAKRDLMLAVRDLGEGKIVSGLPRTVLHGMRRLVEHTQGWMFEEMIPNLKATQMLRATEQLLRQHPDLITNKVDRSVALRAIGKSIDDRFGEMFYGSLFWNRYLKDGAIGSMLSLGWNLGQFRQAGGAAQNLFTDVGNKMIGAKRSQKQQLIRDVTNKGNYVMAYTGLSMMMAGAISYALSGSLPEGLDWTFPRAGGNNPDGSPRRMTTMFNTREVPMAIKHVEEQNSLAGGLMTILWNKTVLTPITDVLQNRDFFGNELYDPDAPWFKRYAQMIDSTLGSTMNPITISGAKRAGEQGGGMRDKAMAFAGFGPAPSYISRSAIQNRIGHAFNKYGPGAATRPYEEGASGGPSALYRYLADDPRKSEARRSARGELDRAMAAGDEAGASAARQKLVQTGMSPTTVGKLRPGESDVYMFSRLPEAVQKNLAHDMDNDEFAKYVQRNIRLLGGKRAAELIRERSGNK